MKEILQLKKKKNALLLAHYYQRPEIQELADFWVTPETIELRNLTTVANEIIAASLKRNRNRGVFYKEETLNASVQQSSGQVN